MYKNHKKVREDLHLPIVIMLDTKGPEYRIKTFKNGKIFLKDGDKFTFTTEDVIGDENKVSVSYKNLAKELSVGDSVLLNNGLLIFTVDNISGPEIECTVVAGGENANDIELIAKIENQSGFDNMDEICEECDGFMVARGDMGVEVPFDLLPSIQKKLITKCRMLGKRVITATEMLESMITNPRPTRAEISDVAKFLQYVKSSHQQMFFSTQQRKLQKVNCL